MLTFAITPALFIDDGEKAFVDLKARIAAEKAAKSWEKGCRLFEESRCS